MRVHCSGKIILFTLYFMNYLYIFQHPFIATALDSKPLRELIFEHKAEVVEEVTEEDDDHEIHVNMNFFL